MLNFIKYKLNKKETDIKIQPKIELVMWGNRIIK